MENNIKNYIVEHIHKYTDFNITEVGDLKIIIDDLLDDKNFIDYYNLINKNYTFGFSNESEILSSIRQRLLLDIDYYKGERLSGFVSEINIPVVVRIALLSRKRLDILSVVLYCDLDENIIELAKQLITEDLFCYVGLVSSIFGYNLTKEEKDLLKNHTIDLQKEYNDIRIFEEKYQNKLKEIRK